MSDTHLCWTTSRSASERLPMHGLGCCLHSCHDCLSLPSSAATTGPPTCTPAHCRTAGCSGASAPLCRSHTAPPGWPGSPCPPGGGTAQRRRGGRRHRQARRAAALPHRPRASARRSALPVQCLRDAGWAAWQVDVEAVNNSGLKQVLLTQPQAGPWYAASRHGPQPPHLQAHATAC